MGLFKQTATFIFKIEAYRGYLYVLNNGIPKRSMTFFSIIGTIFWVFVLLAWIIHDGLPTIFGLISLFSLVMVFINVVTSRYNQPSAEVTVEPELIDNTVIFNLTQERYTVKKIDAAKMWAIWFLVFVFLCYLSNQIPPGGLLGPWKQVIKAINIDG